MTGRDDDAEKSVGAVLDDKEWVAREILVLVLKRIPTGSHAVVDEELEAPGGTD